MWLEADACAPVNAYGRSKAAAEAQVRSAWARHVILRPSIIYGPPPLAAVPRPLFLQARNHHNNNHNNNNDENEYSTHYSLLTARALRPACCVLRVGAHLSRLRPLLGCRLGFLFGCCSGSVRVRL